MAPDLKLYQILEKWNVDPKIGVEIQDWIEDTFEKKQATSMFQYHETKQLPMQTVLWKGCGSECFNSSNTEF